MESPRRSAASLTDARFIAHASRSTSGESDCGLLRLDIDRHRSFSHPRERAPHHPQQLVAVLADRVHLGQESGELSIVGGEHRCVRVGDDDAERAPQGDDLFPRCSRALGQVVRVSVAPSAKTRSPASLAMWQSDQAVRICSSVAPNDRRNASTASAPSFSPTI